jgi:hypothetical protein
MPNSANCSASNGGTSPYMPTAVGSYSGSASPYGTFDQGGNVWEYNETILDPRGFRGVRGGSFNDRANGGLQAALSGTTGALDALRRRGLSTRVDGAPLSSSLSKTSQRPLTLV